MAPITFVPLQTVVLDYTRAVYLCHHNSCTNFHQQANLNLLLQYLPLTGNKNKFIQISFFSMSPIIFVPIQTVVLDYTCAEYFCHHNWCTSFHQQAHFNLFYYNICHSQATKRIYLNIFWPYGINTFCAIPNYCHWSDMCCVILKS